MHTVRYSGFRPQSGSATDLPLRRRARHHPRQRGTRDVHFPRLQREPGPDDDPGGIWQPGAPLLEVCGIALNNASLPLKDFPGATFQFELPICARLVSFLWVVRWSPNWARRGHAQQWVGDSRAGTQPLRARPNGLKKGWEQSKKCFRWMGGPMNLLRHPHVLTEAFRTFPRLSILGGGVECGFLEAGSSKTGSQTRKVQEDEGCKNGNCTWEGQTVQFKFIYLYIFMCMIRRSFRYYE